MNPAQRLRRKLQGRTRVHERMYLDAHQVAALAARREEPWGVMVRRAAWSGLRAGEIGGLRARDVDTLRGWMSVHETVVQGKGGPRLGTPKSGRSRRTVPIPPALARELAARIAGRSLSRDDRLFAEPDGGLLVYEHFYRGRFKRACAAIGPRHMYASLIHAQGRSMLEVSRWMGHSTYQLTADTYSHLWDGEDEQLSNALDAAYLGASPTSNVVPLHRAG